MVVHLKSILQLKYHAHYNATWAELYLKFNKEKNKRALMRPAARVEIRPIFRGCGSSDFEGHY